MRPSKGGQPSGRVQATGWAPSTPLRLALLMLVTVLIGAVNCNEQNAALERQAEILLNGSVYEKQQALAKLHEAGLPSIPVLISAIDADSGFTIPLSDPTSSYIPPGLLDLRPGLIAAHAIELILACDSLMFAAGDSLWVLGVVREHYVFTHGLIGREGQDRGLTVEEIDEVKTLYEKWWQVNKNKSLDQLRSDWKNSKRPLSNSGYGWW